MKKLTLAISALAAAFGATAAKADVSVSGSGSAAYIAPAGSGDAKLNVGQFVSFRTINNYCFWYDNFWWHGLIKHNHN